MELQKPRGTRDFLFKEMKERKLVENTMRKVFESYGYQEIKTPIFEDLSLFTLKSGEGIIEEIYNFQDKGGRDLALRPELTAPVARLYLNELQKTAKPIKMYYFGSCFRYERPQNGRYRQFWQMGCELIGGKSPDSEAEIIAMASQCLEELGLENYQIHLGNLGILRGILNQNEVSLNHQNKIMALIDKGDAKELNKFLENLYISNYSKDILLELIDMQGNKEIIKNVKKRIYDYPTAFKSIQNLEKLLEMLEAFGCTNYTVNLGIARGLDYYTGTVFEIYVEGLGAQKQISGGGTYNLIEVFGGEKVESTGFAFGFDRVMGALEKQGPITPSERRVDVFVAPLSYEMKLDAFKITRDLRKSGISTEVELTDRKFKKVLSFANKSGAKYTVIVGARDMEEGKVTLRDMESGQQDQIPLETIVTCIHRRIDSDYIKKNFDINTICSELFDLKHSTINLDNENLSYYLKNMEILLDILLSKEEKEKMNYVNIKK